MKKFNYFVIAENGDIDESSQDLATDKYENLISAIYGMYIDYSNPAYANEKHVISESDIENGHELYFTDFQEIGEIIKQRPDFAEVLKYLTEEFGGNYYYKQFMYDFFKIDVEEV